MSCVYFCLSQNVMLTPDFVHLWTSKTLHIADCPSFFSCFLWCGLLAFVLPLLHLLFEFFLLTASLFDRGFLVLFLHAIHTWPYLFSGCQSPKSTPQPGSRAELQSHPFPQHKWMSLRCPPPSSPCSSSSRSLTWGMNGLGTHHCRNVQLWRADSKLDLSPKT